MIETTVTTETLTGISLPPGTVVGYRRNGDPIYNIAGGDGTVEVESDDDGDEGDETEVDDDSDEDDDTVTLTKDEFNKILAAKQKADSEAAARKRFLREAGLDPKTGKPVVKPKVEFDLGDDDDDEDEDEKPVKKAEVKASSKFDAKAAMREAQRQLERQVLDVETRERERALVLVSAVPEALSDAELNPKYLKRALKHLDLNSVEVDSDGDIDGLDDQIAELKQDFPEFFKRTRMKEAAKEVADTKTVGGGAKKVAPSDENLDFATRLKNQLYRGNA